MDVTNERWEAAIVRAKELLVKYEELDKTHEKYTFSSAIDYLKGYLYLADVWKRKSPAVLELLEEITFDIEKWRDRIPFGPHRAKQGRQFI